MNTNVEKKFQSVTIFMVIAIFAILAIGITITGIGTYKKVSDNSQVNFVHRTSLSYLLNQVRLYDYKEGISVGEFYDSPALFLNSKIDEIEYTTII